MNRNELYYTAGLMDGEGSIMLLTRNAGAYRSPHISVASTTIILLEPLKGYFGGCISTKKLYEAHHRPSWTWSLVGNKAIEFCEVIGPLLREPTKHARARLIVDEYKGVTPRNGKYSEEQRTAKVAFEERFFKL